MARVKIIAGGYIELDDSWIDANDRLPTDKTWVEVIYIYLGIVEHFYYAEYSKWPDARHPYWRYITHSIFNPVAEEVHILKLH